MNRARGEFSEIFTKWIGLLDGVKRNASDLWVTH
jgi:hypothetical protein